MTRVLIADDHDIVHRGLTFMLTTKAFNVKVIGHAKDGMEAVKMCDALKPDIIVMDIGMPKLNGIEAAKQILKKNSYTRVIMLSMYDDDDTVMRALETGVSGYVLKNEIAKEIIEAVQAVANRGSYLSPGVSSKVLKSMKSKKDKRKSKFDTLTKKERHVLQLIAEGYSTKEIANLLEVSFHTAKTHRNHIMKKLEMHSTADLTRYALGKNLTA